MRCSCAAAPDSPSCLPCAAPSRRACPGAPDEAAVTSLRAVILRTSPRTCEQWSLGDLETLRLVLRGGSVIDWRRIHFQTRDDVDRYLRLCLFEPDDPSDRAPIQAVLDQAVQHLRPTFPYRVAEE